MGIYIRAFTLGFRLHSCRIGAPTSAAEAGLPPWLIQTLRWWSSKCFSINFVFELCLLFSRRFQVSWLPQTPQVRGPGTPYKDVALLVFHSQFTRHYLGCNWVHTCHSYQCVAGWVGPCLVPRPHYYKRPMRFGSCGPRKFLRPRQTRRSETFCLTWGGAFGSGRAVSNFSALMKDFQQPWRVQNRAFLFYARFHC